MEDDQLHSRGGAATTELAELARLCCGMRVLDIGAGVGGPARHLAAHYGVHVTGIDIAPHLVRRAEELTRASGLSGHVDFQHGNALSAPFATHTFDCVWMQHVLSHIAAKGRLFAEVRRILLPRGVLALHEIVLLDSGAIRYPLPWARTPIAHFPAAPRRLRTSVESAGFRLRVWRDTTASAREWWRGAARGRRDQAVQYWPGLLDSDASLMLDNVVANLEDGRLGVAIAVFDKIP
jgi:cyclopropane fatty-acyl-phospholipid synthase-like methyltransferase